MRGLILALTHRSTASFLLEPNKISFERVQEESINTWGILVEDIKYRPPIFRKKTENKEKCANFKGKIQFYREIQL